MLGSEMQNFLILFGKRLLNGSQNILNLLQISLKLAKFLDAFGNGSMLLQNVVGLGYVLSLQLRIFGIKLTQILISFCELNVKSQDPSLFESHQFNLGFELSLQKLGLNSSARFLWSWRESSSVTREDDLNSSARFLALRLSTSAWRELISVSWVWFFWRRLWM